MKKVLSLLCSIPVILVALYFIPFLGIVLILFRLYFKKQDKIYMLPTFLIATALTIFIPKIIYLVVNALAIKVNIPFLDKIISSDLYEKLIKYGKLLIIVGVLYLILRYIFTNIFMKVKNKLNSSVNDFVERNEQRSYEIQKENDLKMRETQEKVKNTHFVSCPTCGKDNIIHGNIGTCTHCRGTLVYKEKEKKTFDVDEK